MAGGGGGWTAWLLRQSVGRHAAQPSSLTCTRAIEPHRPHGAEDAGGLLLYSGSAHTPFKVWCAGGGDDGTGQEERQRWRRRALHGMANWKRTVLGSGRDRGRCNALVRACRRRAGHRMLHPLWAGAYCATWTYGLLMKPKP